jgi:hypothetical protein
MAQRVYGLVQGYEDLNDHTETQVERLRVVANFCS